MWLQLAVRVADVGLMWFRGPSAWQVNDLGRAHTQGARRDSTDRDDAGSGEERVEMVQRHCALAATFPVSASAEFTASITAVAVSTATASIATASIATASTATAPTATASTATASTAARPTATDGG